MSMRTTTPFCRVLRSTIALGIAIWLGCSSQKNGAGDAPNAGDAPDRASAAGQAGIPAAPAAEGTKKPTNDSVALRASASAPSSVTPPPTSARVTPSSSQPEWVTDYTKPQAASPSPAPSQGESLRPAEVTRDTEPTRSALRSPGMNVNPLRDGTDGGFGSAPSAPPVAGQVAAKSAAPAALGATAGTAPALLSQGDTKKAVAGGDKSQSTESAGRQSGGAHSIQVGVSGGTTLAVQEANANVGSLPAAEKAARADGVSGDSKSGKGHSDRPKFDPIAENGPIFDQWPKQNPKLAIVITGREDGYLEPCGCAGLDRMKGGLSRRHTMIRELRQRGWPLIAVDVGGNSKGFGRQAQLKYHATADAMKIMGYDAIALGTSELQLPADALYADVGGTKQQPSPFVSANVGLFALDPNITPHKQVIQRGGFKVGVTSVLGSTYQRLINNPEIVMVAPAQALAKMAPDLKKECNILILLAHATMQESIALSNRFPEFDIVVTAGGPGGEPPKDINRVPQSRAVLVEVGDKGMNAVVLGVFDDPNPQNVIRYQRIPLDSRFEASAEMKKVMLDYQLHVSQLGLAGLGIKAMQHPQAETHGAFVGSRKCESCHQPSYDIWRKTGHAKAYPTLVNLDPPRQFDPECVSCHVVGWNPQQFFPYLGGFESIEKTSHLGDVGCESCHGPGELHVKAEMGSDESLKKKMQQAVRVTKEQAEKHLCLTCHDGDNSPDFQFKTYWPKVEHKEKE